MSRWRGRYGIAGGSLLLAALGIATLAGGGFSAGCVELLVALGPGFGINPGGNGGGGGGGGGDTTRRITLDVHFLQIVEGDLFRVGVDFDLVSEVVTDSGPTIGGDFDDQRTLLVLPADAGGFASALVLPESAGVYLPIALTDPQAEARLTAFPILRNAFTRPVNSDVITNFTADQPLTLPTFRPNPFAAELFSALLSTADAEGVLSRLETAAVDTVLSVPRVTLFNRQAALISVQGEQARVEDIDPNYGDLSELQLPDSRLVTAGPVIDVRGAITENGIELTLRPGTQVVQLSRRVAPPTLADEPITLVTPLVRPARVRTVVTVPVGETLLIGGLRRFGQAQRDRGLPLLMRLPFLNRPFRDTALIDDQRFLMIMITPRVTNLGS